MELRDFYAVRRRIGKHIRKTPLARSPYLSDLCGGEVWLKLENQQLTSSFKIRGALNKLIQLSDEDRAKGIVAASSGNHAQGLGYAARMLDIDATIVVPGNTPKVKIDAIKGYGVELMVHGDEYMDAERLAREMEKEGGKPFVSGYNDIDIIAGQGSIGLEMVEEVPDLDVVLVPVGGGGLISGIGCAVKNYDRRIEVIGVQSVASPVMCESIRRGRIVDIQLEESVAEGLHGGIEEGSITFDMCRDYVDDFILVKEETILKAIGQLITEDHQVVEGAGAVVVAAVMEEPGRFEGRRVGAVISGGNIGRETLEKVLHNLNT
jgi:threonine dehydratase